MNTFEFTSHKEFLDQVEKNLNEKLEKEGKLTLGDIYDEIGLERHPWGDYDMVTHTYSKPLQGYQIIKTVDSIPHFSLNCDEYTLNTVYTTKESAIEAINKWEESAKVRTIDDKYVGFVIEKQYVLDTCIGKEYCYEGIYKYPRHLRATIVKFRIVECEIK